MEYLNAFLCGGILCAIGHQSKEDLLTAGVPVVGRFSQLESLLLPQNTAKK